MKIKKLPPVVSLSLILAVFITSSVIAEPVEISLEEVLAQALSESPLVKGIDARLQNGIAEALSTRIWKNPELSSSLSFPVSYPEERGSSEFEVSLSQSFQLTNLGLRAALAGLMSKASHAEQKRELLEFTERIRLAYARLWALDQKIASLREAEERARKVREKLNQSAAQGLYSSGERDLLVAEVSKLVAERRGGEAEFSKGVAELVSLANISLRGKRLKRPLLGEMPSAAELESNLLKNSLPVQERMGLLKEVAQHQLKVAQRDAFPELTPQLMYRHSDDEKEFLGIGISFPLPTSDGNQAERMKRDAELRAVDAQVRFFSSESFREELKLLIDSYQASLEQAHAYEAEVVPALKKAVTSFESLLDAGQGSVLQVWQTQGELADAQSRALELWVKALSERSELSILVGRDI